MLDHKHNVVKKMNSFAIIAILVCCAIGDLLNYCLRMLGKPGGMYFLWILAGCVLCFCYIYLHELTHALAILMVKRELPTIRIEKFVASCGSPTMVFSKTEYFFVAVAPFAFYCLLLIPLCVVLPPSFFPLPFMPLMYNIFGSMGDLYMINRVMKLPKKAVVIDSGTEMNMYVPIEA